MINIESVNEKLNLVTYPGFTKSIVEFGFVKDVKVNGSDITILIDISSSAPEVKQEIHDGVTKQLQLLGASSINLDIKTPSMPKESSSKGKNIVPQIKNFSQF